MWQHPIGSIQLRPDFKCVTNKRYVWCGMWQTLLRLCTFSHFVHRDLLVCTKLHCFWWMPARRLDMVAYERYILYRCVQSHRNDPSRCRVFVLEHDYTYTSSWEQIAFILLQGVCVSSVGHVDGVATLEHSFSQLHDEVHSIRNEIIGNATTTYHSAVDEANRTAAVQLASANERINRLNSLLGVCTHASLSQCLRMSLLSCVQHG